MRIANATDLYGNPYLTAASIGSSVETAVENALESGSYLDNLVNTEELGSYVKNEDLADKLEELGIVPGGGATVAGKKIQFTKADSESVTWNENVATFTHNLDCIPAVVFFDKDNKQVIAEIEYVNANSFTVNFGDKNAIDGTWTAVVYYAGQASSSAPVEP